MTVLSGRMPVRATATTLVRAQWSGLLLAVVAGSVALAVSTDNFATQFNQYTLLRNLSLTLVIGFGQMITLAVGELNLSLGALGGLVAVVSGGMMDAWGLPLALAIVLGLALGAACGFANGMLITRTKISGFIITLATGSAFAGIDFGITKAQPFSNIPSALVTFGQGRSGGIPYQLAVPILVALLMGLLLNRVRLGRHLLAVGGNRHAAELAGISPARAVVWAHVVSGLLAAIAAIMTVAQLASAQPTIGDDWLIQSFTVPIIGGAALAGGDVSATGTVLAAAVITLIENGLVLENVDPYWVQFLLGMLILGAVGLSRFRSARVRSA